MSFSDLFSTSFSSRNRGHFSAIVRVALADGKLADVEKVFLDQLARRLDVSEEEYAEILADPLKYPINPPYLYSQRLDRLYDLARMVYVDHNLGDSQVNMLKKFCVGLGFTPSNVDYIVAKAFELVKQEVDLDTFIYEMTNMNK
ncbi:TerB family tellurite resistance protein [Flavobacterium ardleyense]|uniref:TerB family tellurite resistance protein n=1 Tax=Flavobacterium ardleyense TaxID=2038737 RepID=UPI00298D4540|nr:TerB family tellurite resistance protein [Flavobacterium ardleyense]